MKMLQDSKTNLVYFPTGMMFELESQPLEKLVFHSYLKQFYTRYVTTVIYKTIPRKNG